MKYDKSIYYPLFASKLLNGGKQDEKETSQVRESLLALPNAQRACLLSNNMAEALAILDEQFHIPEQFVEYVTVLVREMFFGQFSEQEVLRALRSELAKIPNVPLDAVIQHIQLHIFKAEADLEESEEEFRGGKISEELKKVTLLEALGKFSNLGNQVITSENIKLKSQVALVRPTLTNWLKSYRDELGIGKHDTVARAKFLFESQNTVKLPGGERERIHALVRSLEDNELLNIDPQKQEIVFLDEEKKNNSSRMNIFEGANDNVPDIFERFQSAPVREELQSVGTQTFRAANPTMEKESPEERQVLGRIKSMNVTPVSANAPAPKEDFILPKEEPVAIPQNEPLGTLRFSAKHVLPAERQQRQEAGNQAPPMDPRIQHFRPQEVAIPGAQTKQKPSFVPTPSKIASVPALESVKEVSIASVVQEPQENIPSQDQKRQAVNIPPRSSMPETSVFRIKPNRE